MDVGAHRVDADELAVAATALEELEAEVEGILERNEEDLDNADRRGLISRVIVSSIVKRMAEVSVGGDGSGE